MAVVEKKPEVKTASPFDRLAIASLSGVVYILVSLTVAFWAVPAVTRVAGLANASFGPLLTGVLALTAIVVLAIFGYRLMGGAHSRLGLRAGIFLGFVFLALWAFLSRWVGGIIEGSTYDGWLSGAPLGVGMGIAAALSLLLGYWLLKVFLRPTFEQRMVRLEESGWFSARTFKSGQGTRVRRGTILGILLLAGSGIWVMMNHRVLERGAADWALNIPFTATMAIDDSGDAPRAVNANGTPVLEPDKASRFRIVSPGATALAEGATVDRDTVLKAIAPLAKKKREQLVELLAKLQEREKRLKQEIAKQTDPTLRVPLEIERGQLSKWIESLQEYRAVLEEKDAKLSERIFLLQKELDRFVTVEQEKERERRRADQAAATRGSLKEEMQWISDWVRQEPLPAAAYLFDRYEVRNINDELDPLRYRVIRAEEPVVDGGVVEVFAKVSEKYPFKRNEVVSNSKFLAAVEELKKDETREVARDMERRAYEAAPEAKPMKGTALYASITLLPAVRFTVPLLLMALAIWFAWRVVNLPTFGDFLIATEAEMNKVSWTSRKRLFQDTIVVLVTVVLFAIFLLTIDQFWGFAMTQLGLVPKPVPKASVDDNPQSIPW